MSPEAQRIAIAEACGIVQGKKLGFTHAQSELFYKPNPNGQYHSLSSLYPNQKWTWIKFDPLNDLNAMHEAENVILSNEDTGYAYDMALCRIVNAYEVEGLCNHMRLFHATAAQRAEAFLRTIGKWSPVHKSNHESTDATLAERKES